MRLLIRHGAAISGLPTLLSESESAPEVDRDADGFAEAEDFDLGAEMSAAMDAEELPNLVDRLTIEFERAHPMRLDLALRLRDLLEVRRPARKARFAPVDGIVMLRAGDGYTRLSLEVTYMDDEVFPIILSLDDELLVAHGQKVDAGTLMAAGEAHLPDLLQLFGEAAVLRAFELHLQEIAGALGQRQIPELPQALAFVRNWMLGWVRVRQPGALALESGDILPAAHFARLERTLSPGDARPLAHRQLLGIGRLAERYLGGLAPEF